MQPFLKIIGVHLRSSAVKLSKKKIAVRLRESEEGRGKKGKGQKGKKIKG
jgi:hypothetical protein